MYFDKLVSAVVVFSVLGVGTGQEWPCTYMYSQFWSNTSLYVREKCAVLRVLATNIGHTGTCVGLSGCIRVIEPNT